MNEKIRFEHVYKKYDNEYVLKDISLSIGINEFITILGPSGCGKTTLLRLVNLLEKPSKGDVFVNQKNINSFDPIELRRKIGYAIQGGVLFPNMDVEENILFVPSLLSKKNRKDIHIDINEVFDKVRLDKSLLHRYPDELSGGQQQRVSMGRALAANPDVVLMDEPFSAVDEITREELQNEIKRIQNETKNTILFVTHDVNEALNLGSKVLILNNGVIERFDSPKAILDDPQSQYVKKLLSINLR